MTKGLSYIAVNYGNKPFAFYATVKGATAGLVLVPKRTTDLEWMGTPQVTYVGLEPWELNARNVFAEIHGVIGSRKPYATADSIGIAYNPYNRSNSSGLSWSERNVEEQLLAPGQCAITYQDPKSGDWVISAAQPSRYAAPEVFEFTLVIAFGVDKGYLWDPSYGSMNYGHRPHVDGPNGPAYFRNPGPTATTFALLRQHGRIP